MNAINPVLDVAIHLSSGTLANLTGKHLYSELEEIQNAFVAYVINSGNRYDNWMQAWNDFWQQSNIA